MKILAPLAALLLSACQSSPERPLPLAANVDIARFMGDWHVIAATPTFIDREAFGAVESYRLAKDGAIETTYTFRDGAFDGPARRYTPKGRVRDGASNAVWDMQFVWPFRADYRIAWLAPDYSRVIVAREKRDYAWIMARSPTLPEAQYREMLEFLRAAGYDTAGLRRMPQRGAEKQP
ncbi:MAG: lipocalin family protein [Usitatibacter sp.]